MVMNKNGWGLSEMIVLCCILIGFLLLTVVLVNQLYNDVEQMNINTSERYGYSYKEIENNLREAAKKYYKKNKDAVLIMSDDLLLDDYITSSKLTPLNKAEPCIGYVKIENNVFESYISCEEYETDGY